MKAVLEKIKNFINSQINRLGRKTCLVTGIFIGIIIGYFGHP